MSKPKPNSPRKANGATSPTGGSQTAAGNGSRRDRIVELAAQLFAEKGVTSTTVRDIGDAAGILSGSLYYHFDSKESIVKEIVSDYLRGLVDAYEATMAEHQEPRARLEGLIRASFYAVDQRRHACEIFQNEYKILQSLQGFQEVEDLAGRVQALWMETIAEGVAAGALRDDIPPRIFYRFARDMIWFTVRWYNPDGPDTPDTLANACIAVLLDGYATPAEA